MFVARALSAPGPMAATKSASQTVAMLTTDAIVGWAEDPARPVQIVNGTDFVMPAGMVVNITMSMSTSNTFIPSIRVNTTVVATGSDATSPSLTASNIAVAAGDIVSFWCRNAAFVTRTVFSGTAVITPIG